MDIQTVSVVIAAIGLFIAAMNQIYSSRQANQQRAIELKNQELSLQAQQQALETRQAELFMNLYNRWNSIDIQSAYGNLRHIYHFSDWQEFVQKYSVRPPLGSPENFKSWLNYQILLTHFEGLGVLVKEGLINIDIVEDLYSKRIIWFWETYPGSYIDVGRKELHDPTIYDSIEYLYNEMKQRAQQATVTA
jgi:hypothetical protein